MIIVNDLSGGQYLVNKNINFKTPILRSDLCDYRDAYIAVEGRLSVADSNASNKRNGKLNFKKSTI